MSELTSSKDYEMLLKITKTENRYELSVNNFDFDDKGNITTNNTAWFLLKKSKMKEKYNKYRLKKGDIIKIGRIFTRIKDIKFEKNKKANKEESNFDFDITSNQNGNNVLLKDIDSINNSNNNNNIKDPNKKNKIYSLANQRNATDPNMEEKIQILTISKNSNNSIQNDNDNDNNQNNDNDNNIKLQQEENTKKNNIILKENINSKKSRICRICYLEEESELENPLVQPCKCSGSLKYIHLKCLKHWIMTRSCQKVEDAEFCSVFLFKEVECEICKMKLPDLINHKGKYFYLLDFSQDYKSYLILETITLDEEGNKFIYVISLLYNKIKIGRGILSDILLSDVSVSRIHCLLSVEKNNVFIEDNDSKFGTLVLVQTPVIKMTENLPLFIQIGRTFINFNIKLVQKNFFSCCNVNENPNTFYYYMQNDKQVKLNSVLTVKTDFDINNDENEEEAEIKKEKEVKEKSIKSDKDEIVINESNNDNDEESIKVIIENE